MRVFFEILGIVLVTMVIFVGLLIGALYGISRPICVSQAEVIDVEYQWKVWGGCFFEVNGEWIPSENYRGNVDLGE